MKEVKMPRLTTTLSVIFLLTISLGIYACSSSDEEDSTGSGCNTDTDCGGGMVCEWAKCMNFCVFDSDCKSGQYCHAKGVCTACGVNADCLENQYCLDGECVAESSLDTGKECVNTFECDAGQVCHETHCTPTCQSDTDCPAPLLYCNEMNLCVECIDTENCKAGFECLDQICIESGAEDGDLGEEDGDDTPETGVGALCDPETTEGPACETGLECIEMGDKSFCSHVCLTSLACIYDMTGGCCIKNEEDTGYCAPSEFCADIGLDGKVCTADLTCLEEELKCLHDGSGSNFCSRKCNINSDCPQGSYPNGCCADVGGEKWCVTEPFCN